MTTLEIIGTILLFILTVGGVLGTLIFWAESRLWRKCYMVEFKQSREYFKKYMNLLAQSDKETK